MVIGFPHPATPTGGPGSFQSRLTETLQDRGHRVVFWNSRCTPEVVLVIGGTAKLGWLWRCKSRGTKIVHRLDGINWRHKVLPTPLKGRLMSDVRNWLMLIIRNYLAHHVVYQSKFVQTWWHRRYRQAPCPESIIYNGVDLSLFKPAQKNNRERPVLLCVEGNLQEDSATLRTITSISKHFYESGVINAALLYGGVSLTAKTQLSKVRGLCLLGNIPREKIPEVFARGDVFLNLDINSACPNSVIEALASGVPVVGFDTGSLRELVPSEAGIVVPYGGNPWKLEKPDTDALAESVKKVISRLSDYSIAARTTAEQRFGLDKMVDAYCEVLFS